MRGGRGSWIVGFYGVHKLYKEQRDRVGGGLTLLPLIYSPYQHPFSSVLELPHPYLPPNIPHPFLLYPFTPPLLLPFQLFFLIFFISFLPPPPPYPCLPSHSSFFSFPPYIHPSLYPPILMNHHWKQNWRIIRK